MKAATYPKMLRVNVTREADRKLKKFADETERSLAWHVRRALDRYLEEERR